MTAASPIDTRHEPYRPPASITVLGGLLIFLIIGAVQGGLAMVTNPVDPLGMSPNLLDRAPVDSYFLPGMFLLGIAFVSAITVVGLFFRWQWTWAAPIERSVGFRWPWIGAMSIGTVLLGFEVIELFLVPFHPVMHPLLIAGSLAIVILSLTTSARRYLSAKR